MRLLIVRCAVSYAGRLSANLPSAVRLIMVKADGCIAIHADGGAYKPLEPDPPYADAVVRCLIEKGYDVTGWQ